MIALARLVLVCAALLTASPGFRPTSASAAESANEVLTGELVILSSGKNRFRLVGYDGGFVAPAGISLEPFDGKAVSVTVGANRQVFDIVEKPIEVAPIEHGFEEVSGYLKVVSDSSFTFTGGTTTYEAPTGVDFASYSGQLVLVRIDEGKVTSIKPIESERRAPVPAPAAEAELVPAVPRNCMVDGIAVMDGSSICRNGQAVRCRDGQWQPLGTPCR